MADGKTGKAIIAEEKGIIEEKTIRVNGKTVIMAGATTIIVRWRRHSKQYMARQHAAHQLQRMSPGQEGLCCSPRHRER